MQLTSENLKLFEDNKKGVDSVGKVDPLLFLNLQASNLSIPEEIKINQKVSPLSLPNMMEDKSKMTFANMHRYTLVNPNYLALSGSLVQPE